MKSNYICLLYKILNWVTSKTLGKRFCVYCQITSTFKHSFCERPEVNLADTEQRWNSTSSSSPLSPVTMLFRGLWQLPLLVAYTTALLKRGVLTARWYWEGNLAYKSLVGQTVDFQPLHQVPFSQSQLCSL